MTPSAWTTRLVRRHNRAGEREEAAGSAPRLAPVPPGTEPAGPAKPTAAKSLEMATAEPGAEGPRARRPRRWPGRLLAIAALLAVVAGARLLMRPHPIEVEFAPVELGAVEDLVANSEGGTVRARAQARLGAERAGQVAALPHREGSSVRRGTLLLQLDASTAERRCDAARSELEAAGAAYQAASAVEWPARSNLARAESLLARSLISSEQVEESRSRHQAAEADLRVASARVAGAHANLRLAEDELAHHSLRAPFDGVITRRLIEVGEAVLPGQAVLELVSLDRLYVSAPIDERDAGRLRAGMPARVTLDAHPGMAWPARVTRIAPMVETVKEQNRTIEIELDLERGAGLPQPLPGMTADVELIAARHDGVPRVPTLAVMEGQRVLAVSRDRAESRSIGTGLRNWQWTEVTFGLGPGDRVITSLDRPGLKAGVAIRAVPAASTGGPASDSAATAAAP